MGLRRITVLILVAQVLVPAVLLGVRIADPSLGQLRFGWQMHTSWWGAEVPCR